MTVDLSSLMALCTQQGATRGLAAGLLAGLFLAGAAGSAVHCAPMCGGFVLGQAADRMARMPAAHLCEWRRLRAGLLVPYHLGRLTTYSLLGALAASTTAALGRLPWFTWLSVALMIGAALVFMGQALALIGLLRRFSPGPPARWSRQLAGLTRRIDRTSALGGYALGLVLGLLPCSFLYGAIFAAAASVGPLQGAVAMAVFGLGTVPVLMMIGVAGPSLARWRPGRGAVAVPILMVWNATMLLGAAGLQILY